MIKKLSSFASRAFSWVQESIRALVAALRRWFETTPRASA